LIPVLIIYSVAILFAFSEISIPCLSILILFKLIEKYKIERHGIDISENAKSIATEYMIKTGLMN
jgi:uncharacterized membrane protein